MTPDTTDPQSDADERLAAVLGEYQAALDLGLVVDRTGFVARFPDLPDLADALDALDALGRVADEPDPAAPEPTLADFELVREVGRGGMGVVFEARQRSLGRVVAVKVLTRAAALDDRARRRFLHEARAAALVDHPHVVPVYHVGEEHGVPFYVMPLVPGGSLAAAARAGTGAGPLPPPDTPAYFDAVARIGADAAQALAAAHDQGVVHRDVKPANLLLDPAGKVWVTDFGLAVAPFAGGLTRTGARPGTPRYMSPEQLVGPAGRLDARTDVYSLGATLYELACRRPAFGVDDEPELVRLITQSAPPDPRQVNPAVPPDLETVILKAMARDPADRYPTARDLADDLGRFVGHRPVLARRPGVLQHARKWAWRNRRPVAAVALTLLAGLLAGLSVSAAVSRRAYQAERQARDEADANRRLAIAAVADLGTASDEILAHAPGMQDRQLALLLKCRATLEPFAGDESLPVPLRRDIAWVYYRLGEIQFRVGKYADAEASTRVLVSRIEPLVALEPGNVGLRMDAAHARLQLANCLGALGRHREAWDVAAVALAHAEVALRLLPDAATAVVLVAGLRCQLADLDEALTGPPGASIPVYLAALREYEALRDKYRTGHPLSYIRLASQWGSIGGKYEAVGDYDAAERAYLAAVGYDEHLAVHFQKEPPDIREYSIGVRGCLGVLLVRRGKLDVGADHLRRCVREMDEYVGKYPTVVGVRSGLLQLSSGLTQVEALLGRTAEARAAGERVARLLLGVEVATSPELRARVWALLPAADLRDRAYGEKLLAEHAAKLSPWVRAAVLFRLGRFTEAEAAADGSIAGGFIRSACLARRGDRGAGKAAFDAAAARLAADPLRDTELLLLQREAADLIAAPGK